MKITIQTSRGPVRFHSVGEPITCIPNLKELARSFVATDIAAIRADVIRLGSIDAAAAYSADMAVGQPHWEALDSDEGRAALRAAIAKAKGVQS